MKYYIGVGSNLGSRQSNIDQALGLIAERVTISNKAYNYENPAWIPSGVEEDWNYPFLNTAIEVETSMSPDLLLIELKDIEKKMGRAEGPRWAPRIIDLDILLCDEKNCDLEILKIPHPGVRERPFVLAPLRDLCPSYLLDNQTVLDFNRRVPNPLPLWMGIVNVTEDSFSDGGVIKNQQDFLARLQSFTDNNIQILDLGAESTRPGAIELNPEEEWKKLKSYLEIYNEFKSARGAPKLSVDTRHAFVAERCMEWGADYINDVSGLSDPDMFSLLKNSEAQFIFMHSLSVPADPKLCLSEEESATAQVMHWLESKIETFEKNNILLDRLIFDPGIGFGKTAHQSLDLLKNIHELKKSPVRLLIGHSRKSFMKNFSSPLASQRDSESVGMSLSLAKNAVDILRVHNPVAHSRVFRGWSHLQ